jgi:DNA-directed RNA polymerase subunit L
MEIKIIEEKKNKLVFEMDMDHGFCNFLKEELLNDDKVKVATYSIKHPLISKPRMIVETDGTDPKKTLNEAVNRLKKRLEKFGTDFTKEVS